MLFFDIDFLGFQTRFWRVLGLQLGAKSAALLAAPGVLKPTAFYACINILFGCTKGRPRSPKTQEILGSVGLMLAHFSLLGVFFSLLVGSWALLERFLLILIVFFAFWVALNSILDGPGQVLEPSNHIFGCLLVSASTRYRNALHATKPQFLRCFIDFATCRTQLQNAFLAWLSKLFWT